MGVGAALQMASSVLNSSVAVLQRGDAALERDCAALNRGAVALKQVPVVLTRVRAALRRVCAALNRDREALSNGYGGVAVCLLVQQRQRHQPNVHADQHAPAGREFNARRARDVLPAGGVMDGRGMVTGKGGQADG